MLDANTLFVRFVHHIERYNHLFIKTEQLCG